MIAETKFGMITPQQNWVSPNENLQPVWKNSTESTSGRGVVLYLFDILSLVSHLKLLKRNKYIHTRRK